MEQSDIIENWMDWSGLILGVIGLLNGCGWIMDRRRHKRLIESLEAENRMKEMNLSKMYVDEFRVNIAKPLQDEVVDLKNEIVKLKNAIKRISDCAHRDSCPVYDELQREQTDEARGQR